jgi:predicted DNA-binding WGR domain protein
MSETEIGMSMDCYLNRFDIVNKKGLIAEKIRSGYTDEVNTHNSNNYYDNLCNVAVYVPY